MGKKYIIELLDECNSEFKGIMVFGLTQEKQISVELIPEESLGPYTEPDLDAVRKEAYDKGYCDAAYNCHERCAFLDDAKKEAYQRGYETAKHECEDCNANAVKIADDKAHEAYQKGLSDSKNQDAKDFADMYDSGYSEGLKDAWEAAKKIVRIPTAELHTMFDKAVYYDTVFRDCTASEVIEKIRQYEQEQEEIKVGDEVTAEEETSKFVVTWMNDRCICGVDEEGKCYSYEPREISGRTGRHFPEIATVLQKMRETE